jgi:hypothetical protein
MVWMADYVTKIRTENGDKQIDYNALANLPTLTPVDHKHTKSEITDFPTSLPADGGNADTVDGKHAGDFASATDVEDLKSKLSGISFDLESVTATAEELNYVKGVTSDIQTQLDGKAPAIHNHAVDEIISGTLPIEKGGTDASDASTARVNLGAAAIEHEHSTEDITSGVLSIMRGGTDATDVVTALKNLIAGNSGDELPTAGNKGRVFLKRVIS